MPPIRPRFARPCIDKTWFLVLGKRTQKLYVVRAREIERPSEEKAGVSGLRCLVEIEGRLVSPICRDAPVIDRGVRRATFMIAAPVVALTGLPVRRETGGWESRQREGPSGRRILRRTRRETQARILLRESGPRRGSARKHCTRLLQLRPMSARVATNARARSRTRAARFRRAAIGSSAPSYMSEESPDAKRKRRRMPAPRSFCRVRSGRV